MKTDKSGIYIDLYTLIKHLKEIQYFIGKAERIIYGTPCITSVEKAMADFVMAYNFPDERDFYIRKLCADVEVMKAETRILVECASINCKVGEDGVKTPVVMIYEYIGRIDEGVTKYRASAYGKGKTGGV